MANTNMGTKFYISATIAPNDLALTDFEAIDDWVEVAKVGNIGETGSQVNILNYDTMDTTVTQKAKGIINAGDPTIECSYVPTDQGQLAMRTAAKTNFNYAFKIVHNDKLTPAGTGTTHFNRGLVAGPSTPNGGVEDFILNVFTLALNQEQLTIPRRDDEGHGGCLVAQTVRTLRSIVCQSKYLIMRYRSVIETI